MKAVVSGSRSIDDLTVVYMLMQKAHERFGFDTVMHGDARGVDDLAHKWAGSNRVSVTPEPHPVPDWAWDRIGKQAGPMRNQYMVEQADCAIIIWDGESNGTKSALRLADEKGIPMLKAVCSETDNGWEIDRYEFHTGSQTSLKEFEQ